MCRVLLLCVAVAASVDVVAVADAVAVAGVSAVLVADKMLLSLSLLPLLMLMLSLSLSLSLPLLLPLLLLLLHLMMLLLSLSLSLLLWLSLSLSMLLLLLLLLRLPPPGRQLLPLPLLLLLLLLWWLLLLCQQCYAIYATLSLICPPIWCESARCSVLFSDAASTQQGCSAIRRPFSCSGHAHCITPCSAAVWQRLCSKALEAMPAPTKCSVAAQRSPVATASRVGYRSKRLHFLCCQATSVEVAGLAFCVFEIRCSWRITSTQRGMSSLSTASMVSMWRSAACCCGLAGAMTLEITATAAASLADVKSWTFSTVHSATAA